MFANKWSGNVGSALLTMTAAFVMLGFAVFSLSACSSDEKVAGVSTVETENAYVIQVVGEGGAPVVNAKAVLRAADYLPKRVHALQKSSVNEILASAEGQTEIIYLDYTTDSLGFLQLDNALADSMTLEILEGNRGAFVTLVAENIRLGDSAEVVLNRLSTLTGKIDLSEGEEFAWVQVYGTDRMVKTDSDGRYEIEGLAPADYCVHFTIGEKTVDEVMIVKSVDLQPESSSVESSSSAVEPKSSNDVAESSSSDAESSSSEWDYLNVLDFESGLGGIYLKPTDTTVVMYPVEDSAVVAIVDAGAGREGHAMHWTTSAKTGQWSFMGLWMCFSTNPCDFSVVDSIVYYVRGTGSYSFNLETIIDGATGKAVFLDTLQGADEWERVVVRPSDFMEGDSTYGNMGWDFVSKQVTNIAVPAYFDTEIWIDDIRFYGVTKEDLP